jgi:hypothetical protein
MANRKIYLLERNGTTIASELSIVAIRDQLIKQLSPADVKKVPLYNGIVYHIVQKGGFEFRSELPAIFKIQIFKPTPHRNSKSQNS